MTSDKRDTLVNLITKLLASSDDSEVDSIAELINNISPDPQWSNWIFYSDEFLGPDGSTDVEAVVDKILSYKPIILGPPSKP